MNINDETLSAFLDNELTGTEMDAVRDAVAADPELADRLAELATVDAELQSHYRAIDDRPLPISVTRLLETGQEGSTGTAKDNVVRFPWWRRLPGHTGKAIAAAVVAGVVLAQWLMVPSAEEPAWSEVASVLDTRPSGEVYEISEEATLTPRLTFRNQAGEWCRQFRVEAAESASERIACRREGGNWEQVAEASTEPSPASDTYQTASGGSELDQTLDRMMADSPIGPSAERALLRHEWGSR